MITKSLKSTPVVALLFTIAIVSFPLTSHAYYINYVGMAMAMAHVIGMAGLIITSLFAIIKNSIAWFKKRPLNKRANKILLIVTIIFIIIAALAFILS